MVDRIEMEYKIEDKPINNKGISNFFPILSLINSDMIIENNAVNAMVIGNLSQTKVLLSG